jgi:hypothetical protein
MTEGFWAAVRKCGDTASIRPRPLPSIYFIICNSVTVQTFSTKYFVLQKAALKWCHKTAVSTVLHSRNLICSVTNSTFHTIRTYGIFIRLREFDWSNCFVEQFLVKDTLCPLTPSTVAAAETLEVCFVLLHCCGPDAVGIKGDESVVSYSWC